MLGLHDLHYGTAVIPDRVLEFLIKNPKVRLHLSVDIQFFPGRADKAVAALGALVGTRGLSSLRIKIVYGGEAVALRTLLQDSLKPLIIPKSPIMLSRAGHRLSYLGLRLA